MQAVSEYSVDPGIDRFSCFKPEAIVSLVVNGAEIVGLGIIGRTTERESALEKVRLGQAYGKIFTLATDLSFGAEPFAPAGQTRPVRDVEIALGQFNEANQRIDCAIAGAEIN